MKKIIYNTLIILYALIAIIVTICLLSFNQYKVSEFDSTTVLIINTNNLKEKGFNKGDLVLVDTTQKQEPGEDIFFHATSELGKTTIDIQTLKDKQVSAVTGETTYVLENNQNKMQEQQAQQNNMYVLRTDFEDVIKTMKQRIEELGGGVLDEPVGNDV